MLYLVKSRFLQWKFKSAAKRGPIGASFRLPDYSILLPISIYISNRAFFIKFSIYTIIRTQWETIHGRTFLEIVSMKITLRNRIQERNYTWKDFFGNRVYENRNQMLIFAVNRRLNIHDFRMRTSVSILPVDFRFQAGNPYTRKWAFIRNYFFTSKRPLRQLWLWKRSFLIGCFFTGNKLVCLTPR